MQQNGIRLLSKVKIKLTTKVKRITEEEVKALHRVCTYGQYELACCRVGMILLDRLGYNFPKPTSNMQFLVHALIGDYFTLNKNGNLNDEEKEENVQIDKQLCALPFTLI